MISDDLEALALADAIGALDETDRAELQAQIDALSPAEQQEVARLYDTATALAASAEPVAPPPHLKARVLQAARTPSRYTLFGSGEGWMPTPIKGIQLKVLAVDHARGAATMLIKAEPGAVYPSHHHHGPEECLVLRGSVIIDGRVLHAGDFHHADDGSDHAEITTPDGAEVLIVGAIEDYLPS